MKNILPNSPARTKLVFGNARWRRKPKIIAISESTKKDIVEILKINPDKVVVTYLASSIHEAEEKNIFGGSLPREYILFVGKRSGYKNFINCLIGMRDLLLREQGLRLVCAGGEPVTSNERETIRKLNLEDKIIFLEASETNLRTFYKEARVLVYPSQYEGFGLPILEAFAAGCAVALSKTSSLPEVCGEAGEYFEPLEPDSIGKAVEKILYDDSKRAELIAKGKDRLKLFSWEKTARETAEVYRSVLQG